MSFGELIRQKRNEMKLSQANAAIELHISQSTLSRIESGSLEPDERLRKDIIRFYHLDETDAASSETVSDNRQDPELKIGKSDGRIIITLDSKWILPAVNRFLFVAMLMLTFLVTGYGPVFACAALYIAVKNHYKVPVIILVIVLASVLTFFALDQHLNILPARVSYTYIPE